ncbi:MAG TPA: hypothetical protein VHW96_07050 [Solirubrobacteraceae bacterium]|jgi:hypothetical protein|nr:hypothetical protein [Solirubrobacteraceae bacterium]
MGSAALTETMVDGHHGMVAFLGVAADPGLLDEDRVNLPATEQPPRPAEPTRRHGRLVTAGSLLTGVTLIGGVAMIIFGAAELLANGGGAFDAVVTVIGILLAATHWGWVHVAEYVGLTIDEHAQHATDARRRDWLAAIAPYPRYSVSTSVLADASIRIESVLYRPTLTAAHTFTFVRETDAEKTYEAHTPAEVIAATVETMRRQARLETDRLRELWDAASTAYAAALADGDDDRQRLAAERAAATALSEHINASLLEPPVIE